MKLNNVYTYKGNFYIKKDIVFVKRVLRILWFKRPWFRSVLYSRIENHLWLNDGGIYESPHYSDYVREEKDFNKKFLKCVRGKV